MDNTLNRAMELHDTTVAGIVTLGSQIIVLLVASIHASKKIPAQDAGGGWKQAAVLAFSDALIEGDVPELPSGIWTGILILDSKEERNLIPIPFRYTGKITLRLHLDAPAELQITANRGELTLIGEAVYVEEFPGI